MDLRVELVPVESTLPLRRRALDPALDAAAELPGERDPGVAHVAALTADGEVVGTAVLLRQPFPGVPGRADVWRLRGQATAAALRGQGVGGRVLRYAIGQVALHGGGLLWVTVLAPSRAFYEREGFTAADPATAADPTDHAAAGPYVTLWREVRVPVD